MPKLSPVQKVTPLNLLEEKEKFFADQSYNPQFLYPEEIEPSLLTKHGFPQPRLLDLAQTILDKTYLHRNESDIIMMEGVELSQQQVTDKVIAFLKMHHLEKRFEIVWSSSFIARTTINDDTVKLRLPAEFRKEGLIGMLYHEIGTHALRRVNYEQQPWFKQKTKFGIKKSYLVTEEGLASLNAQVAHSFKSAFIQAIRYVGIDFSQNHSFTQTWDFLKPYVEDPEKRWLVTTRMKRGVADTSHGGGFTKDLVYFQGMFEVWNWLKINNWNPTDLYQGKIDLSEIEKVRKLNPDYQPIMPSFFTLEPEKYSQAMIEIGQYNLFDQV